MRYTHRIAESRNRPLRFESLENRRMLAVTLDLSSSVVIAPRLDAGGLPSNVNVSNQPTAYQSEMSLDVNPVNPLHVAGFGHRLLFNPSNPGNAIDIGQIDLFQSFDGGTTWNTTTIDDGTFGVDDGFGDADLRFDPSIAFDGDGNLYVAYGHRILAAGQTPERDTLIVAKWNYDQETFTQFTPVDSENSDGFLDKWHLATGPAGPGSSNQAVYIVYTEDLPDATDDYKIMAAGSINGGASFSAPVQVNDNETNSRTRFFADPAVGPMGELYVSWHDLTTGAIYIDSDLDGLFSSNDAFGTNPLASDHDVLVSDLTLSLFATTFVPAAPTKGIYAGPVLDVDRSGGLRHGRLYLTWIDAVNATTFPSTDNSDVFLAYSDNDGASWTTPGSVGNVEDSIGTDFNPWVDVDQITGSVNVLYYTTEGDQGVDDDDNDDVHVRLATSIDGGASFTFATMSRLTSDEGGGNPDDYLEYNGLAVHGGTVHTLWSSRVPGGGGGGVDLEALYATASFRSVLGGNVLTITGDDGQTLVNDVISLKKSTANPDYLEVRVNNTLQFAGLMATVNAINIDGLLGNDTIEIDSDIDADFIIHGGLGGDGVKLFGTAASALGNFEFFGDAGGDTLTVNFLDGDPLPRAGFNFNFDGGADQDHVSVIDSEGTHIGYFVNTLTDAADVDLEDGRADSSASADDQTTLRAAVQQATYNDAKTYIFLPGGTNQLSIVGNGTQSQGDLDIISQVTIIGTGAGLSLIDAGPLTTDDRIFDVVGGGLLDLRRTSLTFGDAPSVAFQHHGGAIRVQNGGHLELKHSAIVGNSTGTMGDGGGIYFAPTSTGAIEASVITVNTADSDTGGLYLEAATAGMGGTVTIGTTIIVKNTDVNGTNPDIFVGAHRTLDSTGGNLFPTGATGFTHHETDHFDSVDYVVTSVADTYDGSADPVNMSLRDAIHQANITPGEQEIWLPAWDFVLTRDRNAFGGGSLTDLDVAFGDLDITDSLAIRGSNGPIAPVVTWRKGVVDARFDLIGDFTGDGIISEDDGYITGNDLLIWQETLGSTIDLRADADDNGIVDVADDDYWSLARGNTLTLTNLV